MKTTPACKKHWTLLAAIAFVAIGMVAPSARAHTETVDGVEWQYANESDGVVIGSGRFSPAIPSDTAGALAIPSRLGRRPVIGIGEYAFYMCESLTEVTLPASVKRIGGSAFSDCSALTSVALPEGLKRIESHAFFGTGLETVTVPKSVRWIGGSAFAFSALRSATILGGAISGEDGAFTGCSSLKTLTLGTRVSAISYYAFANYSIQGGRAGNGACARGMGREAQSAVGRVFRGRFHGSLRQRGG